MTCCNCTTIPHDLGKICRQFRPDRYVVSRCLAAQEDDHLSNEFVHIDQFPFRSTLLEEQADPADDFRGTSCVLNDSRGSPARLFQVGLITHKPAQAGIGVGDGGRYRLIHLVRQRGSQFAHGGHPADMRKIRLKLA